MTHNLFLGGSVEYPYACASKIIGQPHYLVKESEKISMSKFNELYHTYNKVYLKLLDYDSAYITLREENKRLKYENEFMLRMINDKPII